QHLRVGVKTRHPAVKDVHEAIVPLHEWHYTLPPPGKQAQRQTYRRCVLIFSRPRVDTGRFFE
ncbi:MAG: hypothetical protein ACI4XO_04325, partial [Akkermansia sp.]